MGTIIKFDEYDYLDYKCPKEGEITELIVSKNVRNKGQNERLGYGSRLLFFIQ